MGTRHLYSHRPFICSVPQSGNVTEFYLFADFLFDLADFWGRERGEGKLETGG
jgi:hypothetical protein